MTIERNSLTNSHHVTLVRLRVYIGMQCGSTLSLTNVNRDDRGEMYLTDANFYQENEAQQHSYSHLSFR